MLLHTYIHTASWLEWREHYWIQLWVQAATIMRAPNFVQWWSPIPKIGWHVVWTAGLSRSILGNAMLLWRPFWSCTILSTCTGILLPECCINRHVLFPSEVTCGAASSSSSSSSSSPYFTSPYKSLQEWVKLVWLSRPGYLHFSFTLAGPEIFYLLCHLTIKKVIRTLKILHFFVARKNMLANIYFFFFKRLMKG